MKMELRPGARCAGYEIVRLRDGDALATLHEARDLRTSERVTLKVLRSQWASDPELLARFEREAAALRWFRHPNVVRILGGGEHEGLHFHVLEALDGETLRERLAREPRLAVEDALDVVLPVCSALIVVHAAGVVHRNLKPGEIFLEVADGEGGGLRPKVAGFEVARIAAADEALTAAGAVLGTPSFMAPEQVQAAPDVDHRADQWALGVTLYLMLTGEKPFYVRGNPFGTQQRIVNEPPPPLRARRPDVSDALEAVISRALSKRRDERYASVKDFGHALLAFARPATRERCARDFDPAAPPPEVGPVRDLPAVRRARAAPGAKGSGRGVESFWERLLGALPFGRRAGGGRS